MRLKVASPLHTTRRRRRRCRSVTVRLSRTSALSYCSQLPRYSGSCTAATTASALHSTVAAAIAFDILALKKFVAHALSVIVPQSLKVRKHDHTCTTVSSGGASTKRFFPYLFESVQGAAHILAASVLIDLTVPPLLPARPAAATHTLFLVAASGVLALGPQHSAERRLLSGSVTCRP